MVHSVAGVNDWELIKILLKIADWNMAGKGKKFDFHGSFKDKSAAVEKEREVGGFIREHKLHGEIRYFVLTVRK